MAEQSARRVALPAGLLAVVRMVGATCAYLLALFAATVALLVVDSAYVPDMSRGVFGLLGLGLAEAVAVAAVLLFWRFVDRRPLRDLGLSPQGAVSRWIKGAGVAALMMVVIVVGWYTLVDGATWSTNPDPWRASAALVGGLLGFLIQGPAEEVLFRGYILENARDQWGPGWAVAVSAVSFTLLHGLNPSIGPLPLLNLILFGAAAALYKIRVDNGQLWGVFGMHTVWNWLQQVVFGLPNSGAPSAPESTLFNVTPNTSLPEPIWGGGFGPEGTLAASVVLLMLIGACLRQGLTLRRA